MAVEDAEKGSSSAAVDKAAEELKALDIRFDDAVCAQKLHWAKDAAIRSDIHDTVNLAIDLSAKADDDPDGCCPRPLNSWDGIQIFHVDDMYKMPSTFVCVCVWRGGGDVCTRVRKSHRNYNLLVRGTNASTKK